MVHIEGSLGQVAVSTCYSPRHAISAVHAAQAQSPHEVTIEKHAMLQLMNFFFLYKI